MDPITALALKKKQAATAALQSAVKSGVPDPTKIKDVKKINSQIAAAGKNTPNKALKAIEDDDEQKPDESNEEGLNKNMKKSKDKFGGKKPHKWSPSCDCPSCQAAYANQNEKRRKEKLSHESTNIAHFLKAISQKNYAQADKYLQGTVEGKLRAAINKAVQKF